MSAKLMSYCWDLAIGHTEREVLQVLCDHADDVPGQPGLGVSCFPSFRRIAWKTGYTRRGVQRIIRRLEADGTVVEVKRGTGDGRSEFEIHLERAKLKAPPQGRPAGRLLGATGGSRGGATGGSRATSQSPATGRAAEGRPWKPKNAPFLTHHRPTTVSSVSSIPVSGVDDSAKQEYAAAVLKTLAALPGCQARSGDREIAENLFRAGIPLRTVEAALWLGATRRLNRESTVDENGDFKLGKYLPAAPVSSLKYFLPIVNEVMTAGEPPAGFLQYRKMQIAQQKAQERKESVQ